MGRRDEQRPLNPLRSGRAWRGIGRPVAAALAIGLAGCGGGHPTQPDAMAAPTWWQPKLGEAKNWDIQLSGAIDVSAPRLMYDLDLWSLVPSQMTLDYGDNDPVTVPAGAQAGAIAQLHARTPSTIVICHVETGLLELTRPDARKFPGYKADPKQIPDNPKDPAPGTVTGAPEAGSVIGWSLGTVNLGTADQRLLDVSAAGRAKWASIMFKRFDLARQIGCDGIEPGHNDVAAYRDETGATTSGFAVMTEESFSWYAEVAKQGHERMLSTGMKNNGTLGAIDAEADKFDWLMIERCGEFQSCEAARAFTDMNKAVLAIDYNVDADGNAQVELAVCPNQVTGRIQDGLFKDVPLTAAVRTECGSVMPPPVAGP